MDSRFRDVPDGLWKVTEALLPRERPKPKGGRPRVPDRVVLAGIVYRLKTGCQWRALPRDFGSGATCHRRFTEWVRLGVFEKIWKKLLEFYHVRKGISWTWASLDSLIVKAPKGGLLRDRTPRTGRRAGRSGTS